MYHIYLSNTVMLVSFSLIPTSLSVIKFFLPVPFVWFISFLAESNMNPFDFPNGESELLSALSWSTLVGHRCL